jgi:hypothetical protein
MYANISVFSEKGFKQPTWAHTQSGAWRNGSARSSYCRDAVRLRLRVVSLCLYSDVPVSVTNIDIASPLVLVR